MNQAPTSRVQRAISSIRRTWSEMEYAQRRMLELPADTRKRTR